MKKRFTVSNKLLLSLFIAAIVLIILAVYCSLYTGSAKEESASGHAASYGEPPKEAHVGVVVEQRGADNATS